ncbi:MAG: class I SAM-dependent methyltransferase [Proteobacteria bacterium]|nr:class I SAM-dependent methyltransferase [Pseudomonadota bacterium]
MTTEICIKIRKSCRVCEGELVPILTLGDLCVSDFPLPDQPDPIKTPLQLMLCQKCYLLQLKHTVPTDLLYRNYWYRSGTNHTMRSALAEIANTSEKLIHLEENDAVLDIGCNDGTLLGAYTTSGIYKTGFDPAENIAQYSKVIADKIIVDFFKADTWLNDSSLNMHQPKLITSIAMFYDLDDPNSFVADIKRVMHPEGLWIVQMSYLPSMLKTNELGNICHEHLEYYSLHSFEYLLNSHGLEVVDAELNNVNGGSLRAYIRLKNADESLFGDIVHRELAKKRVQSIRTQEADQELDTLNPYNRFAFRVDRIKNDVVSFIKTQVNNGEKVFVYGASTKGNTVLQYYGLDHTLITAAAERNPDKWGRVTAGSKIPIVSELEARAAKPDYFLILPWHFVDEFEDRELDYLLAGGRFIMPAPYFSLR